MRDEVYERILDEVLSDDASVRSEYLKHFKSEAEAFSRHMADALIAWDALQKDVRDEQRAYAVGLVYIAIKLHIDSLKLFISGQEVAAGNLLRQVVESIALALLCSRRSLGFLARFLNDDYRTNNAVRDLRIHLKDLNLNEEGVAQLENSQKFYHRFSHPTKLTLASAIALSGEGTYLGATFDPDKLPVYIDEVRGRVSLAGVFHNFVEGVRRNLALWKSDEALLMDDAVQTANSIRKVLNSHGHGFHYAVMRRGEQLFEAKRSRWLLVGAEYPVVVGDSSTHIDFVYGTETGAFRTYLVGECKRADPARARWCFAPAPYAWRDWNSDDVFFDELTCERNSYGLTHVGRAVSTAAGSLLNKRICHIGVELKTGAKGDGTSHGRSIDEAISQVLRGVSGLLTAVRGPAGQRYESAQRIRFVPAIFTTAELWVTDADLGAADLRTGELPPGVTAAKQGWIWFTHNRSPMISAGGQARPAITNLDDLARRLRLDFARSIAIVSPDGLDAFLSADLHSWITD